MCGCVEDWSDKASENSSTNDEGSGCGMEADSDAGASASRVSKKSAKMQNVAAVRKSHLNIVFIGHVGMSSPVCFLFSTETCLKMLLAASVVVVD